MYFENKKFLCSTEIIPFFELCLLIYIIESIGVTEPNVCQQWPRQSDV
jgi:hypothetical protein